MLNSNTLALNRPPQVYTSNNANGTENPDELVRMNALLNFSADPFNGHGEMLVIAPGLREAVREHRRMAEGRVCARADWRPTSRCSCGSTRTSTCAPARQPKRGRYAFISRDGHAGARRPRSADRSRRADARLSGILTRGRDAGVPASFSRTPPARSTPTSFEA